MWSFVPQAATKFNIKQKDGINFLVVQGHLENTPEAVAGYMHAQAKGLSKRRIGEYLGNIKDFNQQVLSYFLAFYDFKDNSLSEALRKLLMDFRLPGEAQQIDRILEKFSSQYFKTNPEGSGFANEDTVYILAFSIIMLNTDLHNPNIAPDKKMTLAGFLANNRGINDGADIPPDVLEGVFNDIRDNEIRMNEGDQWEGEVVTFMAPNKAGWLSKQNHGGLHRYHRSVPTVPIYPCTPAPLACDHMETYDATTSFIAIS